MEYLRPKDVSEATAALESSRGVILAGGTDVCVYMAEDILTPETLIDISGIDSLQGIRVVSGERGEQTIRIGACTTIAEEPEQESFVSLKCPGYGSYPFYFKEAS